jgi:hypothetical protein
MNAQTPEPTERNPRRAADAAASNDDVTPVGTFAAGQSPEGSFDVATQAEVGTYASGQEGSAEASEDSPTE